MKKEILIAVDDSDHSQKAVDYAGGMASIIRNLEFRLFHVQPTISNYIIEEAERNPAAKKKLKEVLDANADKAKKVLARFKARLMEAGIAEADIKTMTQPKMNGMAKDILDHALLNKLDAIVVGRRGITRMQDLLMGSVTRKLLEHSEVTPVWVVDENKDADRILIAVDGSDGAMRAIDHVAFILRNNPDITITLLHVRPKFGSYLSVNFDHPDEVLECLINDAEDNCLETFFGRAIKIFHDAGISRDQLNVLKVNCTVNVGKTIAQEIKKGQYGTLVVGRSGENKSFFFGSVSKQLLETNADHAIWLVP